MAWHVVAGSLSPAVQQVLSRHGGAQSLVLTQPVTRAERSFARACLDMLPRCLPLEAPRLWHGALVVDFGSSPDSRLEFGAQLVRPRMQLESLEQLPLQMINQALVLLMPSDHQWPEWWRQGLAAVLADYARGEPPLPSACWRHRRSLGLDGLRSMLHAANPDKEDARSLVAALLHGRRSHHRSALWHQLARGVDAETAIGQSYGLSLQDLLDQR